MGIAGTVGGEVGGSPVQRWGARLSVLCFAILAGGFHSCAVLQAGTETSVSEWSALPDSSIMSVLQDAVDADSTSLLALQRLGIAQYRRGDFLAAATILEQARRIEPASSTTLLFLGRTQVRRDRGDAADAIFTDLESGSEPDLNGKYDSIVAPWIRDLRWNRKLDRSHLERRDSAKNLGGSDFPPGQVLVPDFWIAGKAEFSGVEKGSSGDTPNRPRRERSYDRSLAALVWDRISELATLLADDALVAFASREQERRLVSGSVSERQSIDAIRGTWGRLREVGALTVRAVDRESTSTTGSAESGQVDVPLNGESLRERADRVFRTTDASAILQGVVSFDGSKLSAQWIWIEPGTVTPLGPVTEASIDSVQVLIVALSEDLSRPPTLRDRVWETYNSPGPGDLSFGQTEGLVLPWGSKRDATRLLRILARRSELERDLTRAGQSYRQLGILDPTDRSGDRGLTRIRNSSLDLEGYEAELWASLEPPVLPGLPTGVVLPSRPRSLLVDDVAASLCPGPLPDQAGSPVDSREDHLGSDPVREWIPLGERVVEPGIGDFPDPPRGVGS